MSLPIDSRLSRFDAPHIFSPNCAAFESGPSKTWIKDELQLFDMSIRIMLNVRIIVWSIGAIIFQVQLLGVADELKGLKRISLFIWWYVSWQLSVTDIVAKSAANDNK